MTAAQARDRREPLDGGVSRARRRGPEGWLWPAVVYFGLAYGLSWAWWVPAVLDERGLVDVPWAGKPPGLLGPLLAAIITTAVYQGRVGLRDLRRRMLRWRVGWRWAAIAVLSPLAVYALAVVGIAVAGGDVPAVEDLGRMTGWPSWAGVAGLALLLLLVDGFGEETGWRGFALPHLQQRFHPVTATLILAALWAGWHTPMFLLADGLVLSPALVPAFLLGMIAGAFVLTWLYNRTGGSVLMVALWHTSYNLVAATDAAEGGPQAVVTTVVMIAATVLVVMQFRAQRQGRVGVLVPAQNLS